MYMLCCGTHWLLFFWYQLVFEGVATPGATRASGIMLDDIEFRDGECPPYGKLQSNDLRDMS